MSLVEIADRRQVNVNFAASNGRAMTGRAVSQANARTFVAVQSMQLGKDAARKHGGNAVYSGISRCNDCRFGLRREGIEQGAKVR